MGGLFWRDSLNVRVFCFSSAVYSCFGASYDLLPRVCILFVAPALDGHPDVEALGVQHPRRLRAAVRDRAARAAPAHLVRRAAEAAEAVAAQEAEDQAPVPAARGRGTQGGHHRGGGEAPDGGRDQNELAVAVGGGSAPSEEWPAPAALALAWRCAWRMTAASSSSDSSSLIGSACLTGSNAAAAGLAVRAAVCGCLLAVVSADSSGRFLGWKRSCCVSTMAAREPASALLRAVCVCLVAPARLCGARRGLLRFTFL